MSKKRTLWLFGKDKKPGYIMRVEFRMTHDNMQTTLASVLFDLGEGNIYNAFELEWKADPELVWQAMRDHVRMYGILDWNPNALGDKETEFFNECYDLPADIITVAFPHITPQKV